MRLCPRRTDLYHYEAYPVSRLSRDHNLEKEFDANSEIRAKGPKDTARAVGEFVLTHDHSTNSFNF